MLRPALEYSFSEWWWKYGGPIDFWVTRQKVVEELVGGLEAVRFTARSMEKAEALAALDINPRGGMRVPHLHLGDEVYVVDRKRWAQFSQNVMKDLSEKMVHAGRVSYDELLSVAQAVDPL
ncbi:MAG TPA: hypothetical protein VF266_02410 [Thermoanaerobaculia bacterium]